MSDRIYVTGNTYGIGKKTYAKGSGSIGVQEIPGNKGTTDIQLSIGRGNWHYDHQATASINMTTSKAHELACILMYLTKNDFPCEGTAPQVSNHEAEFTLRFNITTDLCSIIKDRENIKKEMLEAAAREFDRVHP